MKGVVINSHKRQGTYAGFILGEDNKKYMYNNDFNSSENRAEIESIFIGDFIEFSPRKRDNDLVAFIHYNYSKYQRRLLNKLITPFNNFSLDHMLESIEVFCIIRNPYKPGGDTIISYSYYLLSKKWDPYIQDLFDLRLNENNIGQLILLDSNSENLGYTATPILAFDKRIKDNFCESLEKELKNKIRERYNKEEHRIRIKKENSEGNIIEHELKEYYD